MFKSSLFRYIIISVLKLQIIFNKEYSLIGKIGSFKLQIFSSSLNTLGFIFHLNLNEFLNLIGKVGL